MADAETPEGVSIPGQRRELGLEAAWELDILRDTVNELCCDLGKSDMDGLDLMNLRLKIRGLTVRMGQLASVIMSVFDDDDSTANLFEKVHGRRPPTVEVAHG